MGKTQVKNDIRKAKGKEKESICAARKNVGLSCANCVYDLACNPEKQKSKDKAKSEKPKRRVSQKPTPAKGPKRHCFTAAERKEIMEADRHNIAELAVKYGKPRAYLSNLKSRWKRQFKTNT